MRTTILGDSLTVRVGIPLLLKAHYSTATETSFGFVALCIEFFLTTVIMARGWLWFELLMKISSILRAEWDILYIYLSTIQSGIYINGRIEKEM